MTIRRALLVVKEVFQGRPQLLELLMVEGCHLREARH
jgi:hypothetical protein